MIRTILLPLSGQESDAALLGAAFAFARRQGAHLKVFHSSPDPKDMMAFVGEGMTAPMIDQVLAAAEKDAAARSERVRALFNEEAKAAGAAIGGPVAGAQELRADIVVELGRLEDAVLRHARLCDLILAPQMTDEEDHEPSALIRCLLRESGRPVLVLPTPRALDVLGQKIVIAWNGSAEGARALASSLPFLAQAQSVTVLTVSEASSQALSASAVTDYLTAHGVKAQARALDSDPFSTSHALLEGARVMGADLIISGAYSRSRMSRLIFGGVTAYLLDKSEIPLLMQH